MTETTDNNQQNIIEKARRHRDLVTGQFVTKYDLQVAIDIVTLMTNGFTLTASCGKLLVSPQTILNWREEHPEFDQAIKVAFGARQFYLENRFLDSTHAAEVTKMIFALKTCKTSTDWVEQDMRKIELSGPDGKPIQTQNQVEAITYTVVDPQQADDSEQLPEIEGEVIEEK